MFVFTLNARLDELAMTTKTTVSDAAFFIVIALVIVVVMWSSANYRLIIYVCDQVINCTNQ